MAKNKGFGSFITKTDNFENRALYLDGEKSGEWGYNSENGKLSMRRMKSFNML